MEFKLLNNTEESVLVEVVRSDESDEFLPKGFAGKEIYIHYVKGMEPNAINLYENGEKVVCHFFYSMNDVTRYTRINGKMRIMKNKVRDYLFSQRIQPKNKNSEIESQLKIVFMSKEDYGLGCHYVLLGGKFAALVKTEEEIKEKFGDYQVCITYTDLKGDTVYEANLL